MLIKEWFVNSWWPSLITVLFRESIGHLASTFDCSFAVSLLTDHASDTSIDLWHVNLTVHSLIICVWMTHELQLRIENIVLVQMCASCILKSFLSEILVVNSWLECFLLVIAKNNQRTHTKLWLALLEAIEIRPGPGCSASKRVSCLIWLYRWISLGSLSWTRSVGLLGVFGSWLGSLESMA